MRVVVTAYDARWPAMFEAGHSGEIDRHLAFRDYLRRHPSVAARYGGLKAQLAEQCRDDFEAYMDGKDAFVKETEQQALVWQRGLGEGLKALGS